jgi:3-hydroxyisobutyrate dehydrogenase
MENRHLGSTGLRVSELIHETANSHRLATPLIDVCLNLYKEAAELGHPNDDMVAVVRAHQAHSSTLRKPA